MARRREAKKREIVPDPKFKSVLVSKFINNLMKEGKKSVAQRLFYESLKLLEQRSKQPALEVFEKAIENAKPLIEVKSRRVGGATYQVPVEVRPSRALSLSIKWIINYARARNEKGMALKLAGELLDAANQRGAAIKKREDTHKMAEANRAFAHYRW